jgi:hypothetical protein
MDVQRSRDGKEIDLLKNLDIIKQVLREQADNAIIHGYVLTEFGLLKEIEKRVAERDGNKRN